MTKENSGTPQTNSTPLIPANQSLPEITLRALLLGIVLTIILAAANAYLGLKVGQTISASIPAAIISMSILRFFKNSNVLENTMVQTMASVGEAAVAGIAFISPALLILHTWDHFNYWQTVVIALLGGILGVLFTIPLRRALLSDKTLHYPEGVAISNVFKASHATENTSMRHLLQGSIVGGIISFCQTGLQILSDSFYYWVKTANTVYGFGLGLSPALIAAGYIVGVNIAISLFIGIIFGWVLGIPLLAATYHMVSDQSAGDIAMATWSTHIRYLGVGAMSVGSFWTLITLLKPISAGLRASFNSLRQTKLSHRKTVLRTERDIPINLVVWGCLLLLIPIFFVILCAILPAPLHLTMSFRATLTGVSTLYILIGGFAVCSISAYFAGLIGSTNTPVSGLLISTLLLLCFIILLAFKFAGIAITPNHLLAVILAIGSTMVISSGIAIANDTMQDLKVGQVVGATPWKQQVMLIFGVIVAALIVPHILNLLYNAYGIGGVFPRPGMDKAQMLAAPQAGLMATVAQAALTHQLEWLTIGIGALIALFCIIIDEYLKYFTTLRLPVLAVGVGIYLPLDASMPVVLGGALAYLVDRGLKKTKNKNTVAARKQRGLLIACGLVAGASVMGVILAIPFVLAKSSDALRIMPAHLETLAGILSLLVTAGLCRWIYQVVVRGK